MSTDIAVELQKHGLDDTYWSRVFKDELNIVNLKPLAYLNQSEHKQIEKHVRQPWEKKALEEMFSNQSKKQSESSEFMVNSLDSFKKRQKEVSQGLSDLEKLSKEGRDRSDQRVRGIEEKVRVALDVPKESWMHTGQTLKDVVEKIHGQLEVLKNTPSSIETISDVSVLKSSSGGLALEGIYKTGNLKDLLETRQQLIEVPESFSFNRPKQNVMYQQEEFSSHKTQRAFQKVIEKCGFSFGSTLKVGFKDFGLENTVVSDTSKETEEINQHSSEQSCICNTRYNCVPLASCLLEKAQLRLTQGAMAELKELEKLILYTEDNNVVKNKVSTFFERYGSHVNQGPIHFGGIFWWTASAKGFKDSDLSVMKSLTSKALDMYVGAGYSGPCLSVSAGVEVASSELKGDCTGKHNEALMSLVQLSISKTGGPAETDDLLQWKTHLVNSNKTWSVIDRGTLKTLIPIWEIVMSAHRQDFKDPLKLSTKLMETFVDITKQTVVPMWGEGILSAEESAAKVIQSVNSWSASDGEKHLTELLKLKTSLKETTRSNTTWVQTCLSSEILQDYLLDVAKNSSDTGAVNLRCLMRSLIQPDVYTVEPFPNRTHIISWAYPPEAEVSNVISVSDFAELNKHLQCAKKELEDDGSCSPEQLTNSKVKANCTTALSLNALCQTLRESGQEEVELLILSIITAFGYNRESKAFNHLLDLREIQVLQAKLQNAYEEYSSLRDLSVERAQAFLVVTALTASNNENLNVPVKEKEERLQFVKLKLKEGFSTSIISALEGTDWETIENGLNYIIDEAKHDDKSLKAENIIKCLLLNSNVTFSEVQETEQTTEPAIIVDNEKTHSFMSLLQKLGLIDLYPKKMKQRDVLVIDTLCQNVKPPETERELSSQYLYKLMMLDYRARFLFYKPEASATISESNIAADDDDFLDCEKSIQVVQSDEKHIHPMDIHMAVFLCADDFLRQYMFSKLSCCQFGLPLLVPNPCTQEVEFPLFALRDIKKSWQSNTQSTTDSPGKYKSRHMFKTPVSIVSFIRLGNSSISKSQILNSVISKQKHSVFFHRHCKGSTADSLLMDGVVEIAWYCPSGKEDDTFDDCVAFLNLHGDATDHPKQLEFMQSVSTVNVILVSEQPLDEKAKETIRNLRKSSVPLVGIFSGQESVKTSSNNVRLAAKNRNEAELTEEIISSIQHGVNTHNKITSIEQFCNEARIHQFEVDEDMQKCKEGHNYAQTLMCLLTVENVLKKKLKEKLPLQGKLWQDWCQKDKEQYRLKYRGGEGLENQLSVINATKKRIRKEQLKAALAPSDFIESFIDCLTSPSISQDSKLYMMQWLRIFLDEFNMSALAGLEEEYHSTWETFKCGPKVEGEPTDKDTVQRKLSIISENMNSTSIGLQHIMRETSQMYEAIKSSTKIQRETQSLVMALPAIGAEMLISGMPLELMDGDAGHVPMLWIEAVLNILTEKLGNKKMFVLSVLGLQSSGKSTLLNAMFGLQFTVSAGRCTRGAFMQLIKVDPAIVDKLKYEYVLIVDTEGLRSPELHTNTSLTHDNELATFIIGIGDVTIINIMGENPSEMHDILQICVLAFLRMKQVKITPSCIFVHQNVAEASAGEKNMEGRRNLLRKLDAMAVTAAKEEDIYNVTGFSDIIKFDVKTQVFYFKGLLEGDPPMAPPNPSYSQNVQELKKKVLTMAQWRSDCRFSTLLEVKQRIADLWHGLLKENFVFSFRNTLEMMVYSELENRFSEWSWKLRKHSLKKENELHNQISSHKREDVKKKDLIVMFDQVYKPLKSEVEAYFKEDKNPEILVQWRVNIDKRLENLNSELIDSILKKCKDLISFKKSTSQLDQKKGEYEKELLKMSKDLASKLKDQRLTDQEVEKHFSSIWIDWSTKVANEKAPEKEVSVRAAVEEILQEKFSQLKNINDKIANEEGLFQFDENIHIAHSFLEIIPFLRKNSEKNANQVTQQVTNSVLKYITSKLDEGRDFSESFIHEILSTITSEIKRCTDSKQIKFTKEYEADLSVHLCIQAVEPFQRMHSKFIKKMDPLTYLDSKREQYLQMCKNFCKGANSVTIFADFLCKQLKPAIKQQMKMKTIISICDLLKSNHHVFSGNRSNLENHILKHLAQKKNFEDYVEYFDYPMNYFERFIQEQVNAFCNNQTSSRMLNESLESLKSLVLTANPKVTTEVKEQHGNVAVWLDKFCGELGNHMEIKREDLVGIENEEISELAELKEMVGKSLDEMVMQVKEENQNSGLDSTLTDQVTKHLFASCQGCWAQCPFCNVICTNTIFGHEGDHSVKCHRPEALIGSKWKDTNHFVIEFCTTSISSDASFHHESGWVPYQMYRKAGNPYKDWSITAGNNTQRYWKWFIVQFESEWEKKYELKFAGNGAIPCDWKTITLESALEELK